MQGKAWALWVAKAIRPTTPNTAPEMNAIRVNTNKQASRSGRSALVVGWIVHNPMLQVKRVVPFLISRISRLVSLEMIHMSNLEIYRNDFPALNHEIVKEGHIKACDEFGCAYHTVDGVADPRCPRCGALTQKYIDDNGLTEIQIRTML